MYNEYMDNLFDRRPQPMPQPQPQPQPMPAPRVGEIYLYTVVRGDNVYAISRKFNTTVEFIKDMNHLDDNAMIYPGQKLLIPVLFNNKPPIKPQPRQSYELYF